MKFKEWHQFNFVDNKIMDYLGDMYIKVFRKAPGSTVVRTEVKSQMFSSLMRIDDAVKIFGDCPLIKVNFHTENEYRALCALLAWEEKEVQE